MSIREGRSQLEQSGRIQSNKKGVRASSAEDPIRWLYAPTGKNLAIVVSCSAKQAAK
jgi:hypothetical protein